MVVIGRGIIIGIVFVIIVGHIFSIVDNNFIIVIVVGRHRMMIMMIINRR